MAMALRVSEFIVIMARDAVRLPDESQRSFYVQMNPICYRFSGAGEPARNLGTTLDRARPDERV